MKFRPTKSFAFLAMAVLMCAGCASQEHSKAPRGSSSGTVSDPSISSSSPRPLDVTPADALVVQDGATVQASGEVLSPSADRFYFCPPRATPDVGTPGDDLPASCDGGIPVQGVDLSQLERRREQDGRVDGWAKLTATYRDGRLTVTQQGSPPQSKPYVLADSSPPCPAPAAGWPHRHPGENLDTQAAEAYAAAHPGAVITVAMLRPSADQVLLGVVTEGDPAPTRAALAPAYGERLCVFRSDYTRAQIDHAERVLRIGLEPLKSAGAGSTGEGIQPNGQFVFDVGLDRVTPEVARLVDAQPAGLVSIYAWMRPIR